jgi:hypothetical protein
VTPLSPTDWTLIYDGETVTLSPSIGNWSYKCRSHYFIRNSGIVWASVISQEAIEIGRVRDGNNKAKHYSQRDREVVSPDLIVEKSQDGTAIKTTSLLTRIVRFFGLSRTK